MASSKARTKASASAKKKAPSKSTQPKGPKGKGTGSSLEIGMRAPSFALPDDKGTIVKSSSLKGKKVVLFFYPKDNTPGCTQEACAFNDGLQQIRRRGAVIYGVSGDSVSSHQKFSEKFQFKYPLLSDESKTMLQAYGVWKEKSLYGRKFMGIERTTVLLDEKGIITHIFPKVKVTGHFEEVVEALK